MPAITTKAEMYRLLAAGKLGNAIPQYFSLGEWMSSPDHGRYDLWGIRSMAAGGDRRMRLNVPTGEVARLWSLWYPHGGGNISPMIDRHAVLRGHVHESDVEPFGLTLWYVPPGKVVEADPWRGSFREYGRHAHGAAARLILDQYLWPADRDDLADLLARYPGHVVEFTAADRAIGLVPVRNTVVWEVRLY